MLSIKINRLIGENIRLFREEKNLSQEELAIKADIQRTASISDIENGKRNPTIGTIEKLAIALEIRPIELLDYNHFRNDLHFPQKEELIKAHCESLLQRKLDEVKFVVNHTNELLDFLDEQ